MVGLRGWVHQFASMQKSVPPISVFHPHFHRFWGKKVKMLTFFLAQFFSSMLRRPGPFSGLGPELLRPQSDSWGFKFRTADSRARAKSALKRCRLRGQNHRFGRPGIRVGLQSDTWGSKFRPALPDRRATRTDARRRQAADADQRTTF